MRIAAIVQARTSSKRLPNKVFSTINGITVLDHILMSLKLCRKLDDIIVAFPQDEILKFMDVDVKKYAGEHDDVMKRMIEAADRYQIDAIVRVCADSPFILPWLIDFGVDYFKSSGAEFLRTSCFPKGQNIEIIDKNALKRSYKNANENEKEHVTLHMERRPGEFFCKDLSIELTVDTPSDLEQLNKLGTYYFDL